MCGRARLSSDVSEIRIAFGIPPERPTPNFAPSWNVAPTDPLPVVRYDASDRQRSLVVMRKGPHSLLGEGHQDRLLDLQRSGPEDRHQAGLPRGVPAASLSRALGQFFTNGQKTATGKQPYAIALADRRLMAMAGLWETWRSPAGERIRSFTIITTQPNSLCAELHNRMPAVLKPEAWPVWLGEQPAAVPELKALLAPYPSDDMVCWPVSPRVGNVKNNDPSLIEPIAAA
jgi:putative SOS response-associated peptidase YedK